MKSRARCIPPPSKACTADARALQHEVVSLTNAVRHAFETVVPAAIVPLVTMLPQSLRRKKPDAGPE